MLARGGFKALNKGSFPMQCELQPKKAHVLQKYTDNSSRASMDPEFNELYSGNAH
jgi:hypothetical protein